MKVGRGVCVVGAWFAFGFGLLVLCVQGYVFEAQVMVFVFEALDLWVTKKRQLLKNSKNQVSGLVQAHRFPAKIRRGLWLIFMPRFKFEPEFNRFTLIFTLQFGYDFNFWPFLAGHHLGIEKVFGQAIMWAFRTTFGRAPGLDPYAWSSIITVKWYLVFSRISYFLTQFNFQRI